jgi:hypothetical protein
MNRVATVALGSRRRGRRIGKTRLIDNVFLQDPRDFGIRPGRNKIPPWPQP